MGRMDGKIAVVTGVGAGIGRGVALMFAKEGAKVIGVNRSERGQKTIDLINENGGEAIFVQADLQKAEAIDKVYDVTMEKYGTITTLANCAGILVHAPFLEQTDEDYDKISETNCRAYIRMMRKFLPVMTKENSHGKNSIVNVASVSSIKPESNAYFYGGFKAAIDLITRNLSREFSPQGVRLNVICPGPVNTDMTPKNIVENPEIQAEMCKTICSIGRLGEPEDIAYMATYLCSDEATWVTGGRFVIDGGASMMG